MASNFLGLEKFPNLKTPRLILREIVENDFADFHKLFSDPKVNEHITLDWAKLDRAQFYFNGMKDRFPTAEGIRWVITDHKNNFLGNFGFRKWRKDQNCIERGLQIVSSAWNQGYGSEASAAATEWLLAQSPVNSVDAWISTDNNGAIALIKKQGFVETGEKEPFNLLTTLRFLRNYR
jgi:ribosomal-protein-alanine N-acetyltransferase